MELQGRSILIVEDEPIIAFDAATELYDEGAQVGIANTLAKAWTLLEQQPWSAALIDLSLITGTNDIFCAELRKRDIPFALLSGFPDPQNGRGDIPYLQKPYPISELVRTLAKLAARLLTQPPPGSDLETIPTRHWRDADR